MPESTLHIGTRGSRLALAQAALVQDALAGLGLGGKVVTLKATGDRIQDRTLAAAGGKGLFTKELDQALLRGKIDLAVHSMKDVPVVLPPGLQIVSLLRREDARDVFISPKAASLTELPAGARVGTCSVRRRAQVLRARPDVQIVLLRGNVDTRLAKLDRGELDAIILALAGLKRLGLEHRATAVFAATEWLPALSQGAIGIEMRAGDEHAKAIQALDDLATSVALACERAFQAALDGSCATPIGGFAQFLHGRLNFRGEVIAPDGSGAVEVAFERALGSDAQAEAAVLGREAGLELRPRAAKWLVA